MVRTCAAQVASCFVNHHNTSHAVQLYVLPLSSVWRCANCMLTKKPPAWLSTHPHPPIPPPHPTRPPTFTPPPQILKNIKGAVDARQSVAHSATILANALMHAGTSIDTFLRENLEWLSRATNWAKFSATAGLGVIHRGQLQQGE